jgi:hypothetical protein
MGRIRSNFFYFYYLYLIDGMYDDEPHCTRERRIGKKDIC